MAEHKMEPWSPRVATEKIRAYAKDSRLKLSYKLHAKERLAERALTTSDVLYVLKSGFVYADAEPSQREGLFRYAIEGKTPNTGGRSVRFIVIPSPSAPNMKVVSVMWVDLKE
ncbi:MAG: DUF4258 domain-containing protein [Alphaproteobacteria bacterium]|nr:DUF4258 domain-containing protein [Alphaproteobacteria bacterium]